MNYIVCEISGRQYLVKPGQVFEVDKLDATETLSVDRVLLVVDGEKVQVGKPYLKTSLNFEVLGTVKKTKIRVATYKAKANYRRVIGSRAQKTQLKLKLTEDKSTAKKADIQQKKASNLSKRKK